MATNKRVRASYACLYVCVGEEKTDLCVWFAKEYKTKLRRRRVQETPAIRKRRRVKLGTYT